jgi:hypothetical protein
MFTIHTYVLFQIRNYCKHVCQIFNNLTKIIFEVIFKPRAIHWMTFVTFWSLLQKFLVILNTGYLFVAVKTKSPNSGILEAVDATCNGLDQVYKLSIKHMHISQNKSRRHRSLINIYRLIF